MKKRLILGLLLTIGFETVNAQALEGITIKDNWSVGITGGVVTPLRHSAFWGGMRPNMGVEVGKQLTPVFGFTTEALWSVNTSASHTVFDHSNISLLGRANLMNLFASYQGTPRLFEVEAVAGAGWLHGYGIVSNAFSTKAGFNFNFNLGKNKEWTLAFKPALVWNMDGRSIVTGYSEYNANYAAVQLNAGITYHFRGTNGKNHISFAAPCETDHLNDVINQLRGELKNSNEDLASSNLRNSELNERLTECLNKKPQVLKEVDKGMEITVSFNQGQTKVSDSHLPSVDRIATYMKQHTGSKVQIKGYASPEGSKAVNDKIAIERAQSVKSILVNKFGIAADRIITSGSGVGNEFSQPTWNRAAICTLID